MSNPNRPMIKFPFAKIIACLAVVPAALPCLAREAEPARPNVILCMTDDQGWSDNRYKLMQGKDGKELFDLTEDLGETKNIAGDKPEIVERMSKELNAWLASVKRSKEGAD
jgi:hypothetical protein